LKRFLLLLILCGGPSLFAQVLETKLDGSEQGQSVVNFLQEFEKDHSAKFFFLPEWFDQLIFEKNYDDQTLNKALQDILQGSDITFVSLYDYAIIFSKDPARALEREMILRNAQTEQKDIIVQTIGNKTSFNRNKKIPISGTVIDDKSKEPLAGVAVFVQGLGINVVTSSDGKYNFIMPAGEQIVTYQYLNYEEKVIDLRAYEPGNFDLVMVEVPHLLQEVVVSDHQLANVTGKVGLTSLKMNELRKMPAFLGEVDIIKQIQVLPGVTSVGEVSSGFNVRGGAVDQNLVLYDGVQIFNNSHVFGFFSAFSSDAIKDASFYKGGIPAEYGGRISSVLSITSKEGNYEKWGAEGGVGLISSHLTVGGPIKKDVSSVIVSVRSSYSDWLLKKFTAQYPSIQNSTVSFYDISAKLTHKFGANDKLSFSGYMSKDNFGLPSDTTFTWQNLMGSLRLDHIFSEKASSSITLGYGEYSYKVNDDDPFTAYEMRYKISYPSLKADMIYDAGKHKLSFGLNSTYYKTQPASIAPNSAESNVSSVQIQPQQSLENAIFASDGFELNEKLHVDIGFRLSMFSSIGAASVRAYKAGEPLTESSVIDTINYSSGKTIKNYFGPEPRISFRYTLSQRSSVKIGYNKTYQYIHLISNSVAVTPIDIWQPSNTFFKPQIGDQISAGYFHDFKDNVYEVSVETFYKEVKNLLDFKDGAKLVLNPWLETELLRGKGKSYGAEFSINKTKGRLSGSFNYTYSRSLRQVKGPTDVESINRGNQYPSNYDQPNVFNLNWKYGLSRRFSFTGNFTYHTGRPITVPYSYSTIDHIPVVNFSDRNQYRVPDYHRLDVAIVMEGNHKRKKFWDGTWTLSFYNVYARRNVYTVFYAQNENGLQSAYRMSIVGTVLPSLSYRFKI
jgi:hypothetical protein